MVTRRTVAALFLMQTLAAAGFAQEYGRASGGQIAAAIKTPSAFSGSLQIAFPFLSSNGVKRNGATFGGTLVKDRIWFFASAEKMDLPRLSAAAGGADANLTALLDDRQSLGATLRSGREMVSPQFTTTPLTVPSSFLSLRYDGIISSNSFFSATVSRRKQ